MNDKDYGIPHSAYYHRRYEGYTERLATDAMGKRHIERVYIGEYYCQDAADNKRVLIRIQYAALYVVSAGLFIVLSSKSEGSNCAVYVGLAGEWINAAGLLGASAAMFLINRTEAGITYAKTLSQSEPPRDGYYIDS